MKTTYQGFIDQTPTCRKFEFNPEARDIFETILSRDDTIIAMVDMVENKKPALAACVLEVEAYYNRSRAKQFDLTDKFTKQALGRMVKSVLEPFGYEPKGQKELPNGLGAQYVTSASTYQLTGIPSLKIVKTIVAC